MSGGVLQKSINTALKKVRAFAECVAFAPVAAMAALGLEVRRMPRLKRARS